MVGDARINQRCDSCVAMAAERRRVGTAGRRLLSRPNAKTPPERGFPRWAVLGHGATVRASSSPCGYCCKSALFRFTRFAASALDRTLAADIAGTVRPRAWRELPPQTGGARTGRAMFSVWHMPRSPSGELPHRGMPGLNLRGRGRAGRERRGELAHLEDAPLAPFVGQRGLRDQLAALGEIIGPAAPVDPAACGLRRRSRYGATPVRPRVAVAGE